MRLLLPLLLLISGVARAACDADREEWKRRIAEYNRYDQAIGTGWFAEASGGWAWAPGGGPELRLAGGLWASPPLANPHLIRGHVGPMGAWFAPGLSAALRPDALTLAGELRMQGVFVFFGAGLRGAVGPVLREDGRAVMTELALRGFLGTAAGNLFLDASLHTERDEGPTRGAVLRLGFERGRPFRKPPPHECRPPLPEWFDDDPPGRP